MCWHFQIQVKQFQRYCFQKIVKLKFHAAKSKWQENKTIWQRILIVSFKYPYWNVIFTENHQQGNNHKENNN